MAIRINATAIRNCPAGEVRAVMSDVIKPACPPGEDCTPVGDQLQIHEHNGWTWFTTSVWGVSAGDLNRGLCRLARPALQFTTSDGDRWYLMIHGGPAGQVHFVHEFWAHRRDPDPAEDEERLANAEEQEEEPEVDPELAFLEEDRPARADQPRTPFDVFADELGSIGAHIPDAFRAEVAALPYSQAVARYRRWHAEQVSAALTAAGILHDADAVRAVLLWETATSNEVEHDLGNLPRLLAVLGLGGEWDTWVGQAEAPPPDEAEEEYTPEPPPPPEDHITPVLTIADQVTLSAVEGGSVALPLKELGLLSFPVSALAIDEVAGFVLTVTLPPDYDRSALTPPAEDGTDPVEITPDGFRLGRRNHLGLDRDVLRRHLGKRLARLLYHLPAGSHLDIAFALDGYPELTQRYRGPVREEQWHITDTSPALTHAVLTEALDLSRTSEEKKFRCRDEAEASVIVELTRRDPNLWTDNVERRGRNIRCKDDILGYLPRVIFRHRFAEFWDVATHDQCAAQQIEESIAQQSAMRRAGVEAARRRAAPHDPEPLLEGRHGLYWRSDFAQLTELEQETREKVDQAMAELGFRHLGDLVAKKQRDIVLRVCGSADGLAYGILMGKRTMYLGCEFFTRFANNSTLTTTTNGAVESHPATGLYYQVCPGFEVAALLAKHRWGIGRFHTHRGTDPVPLEMTLLGVAQEMDDAFNRRAATSSE